MFSLSREDSVGQPELGEFFAFQVAVQRKRIKGSSRAFSEILERHIRPVHSPGSDARNRTAAQQMGCLIADNTRRGVELALKEIAKNGPLGNLGTAPAPTLHPLQVSDKNRIRMAELDSVREIEPGQDVGETLMAGFLRDIDEGEVGFLDGWIWDNAAPLVGQMEG